MSTTRRTRVRGTGFRKMGKFRPVLRYRAKKFIKPMPIPEKIKPEALVELPEGVTMKIDKNKVTLTKSENSLSRKFPTSMLTISQEKNNIKLKGNSHNAKNRAIVGTFNAHINNMLKGLEKPFLYKLRIASVHFPMTAAINNNIFELKNFIGGKKIRKAIIPKDVDITVNGSEIEISSRDIELAGLSANRLEQLTRIVKRDRRVFQDGIFIIEKPRGKLE
jgi:large subunit ribosomal protein L6